MVETVRLCFISDTSLFTDRLYCIDLFSCIAASLFNKLTYLLSKSQGPGPHLHMKHGYHASDVLFCSSAVLDPRVRHTMDVLSPFNPVLCHSD